MRLIGPWGRRLKSGVIVGVPSGSSARRQGWGADYRLAGLHCGRADCGHGFGCVDQGLGAFRQGKNLGLPATQKFDLSRQDALQADAGSDFVAFTHQLRRLAFDGQQRIGAMSGPLGRNHAVQADAGGGAGRRCRQIDAEQVALGQRRDGAL